jgi:hypothetical protein
MKIHLNNFNGERLTLTIGEAVAYELLHVGGHGYGQIEQLERELAETQRFLVRLCDIIAPSLTKEEIFQLFGINTDCNFNKFEVVDE